jgi:hypothetical protein
MLLGCCELLWIVDWLIYHTTLSEQSNARPFWSSPSNKLLEKVVPQHFGRGELCF